jgi:hypothetical protein
MLILLARHDFAGMPSFAEYMASLYGDLPPIDVKTA